MDAGALPVTSSEALEYYRHYVPTALLDTWIDLGPFEEVANANGAIIRRFHEFGNRTALHERRKRMIKEHEQYYDTWTELVSSKLQSLAVAASA